MSSEPEALLSARGIGLSFGGVTALAAVDIAVREGELVGLIGPNGAGKTTLIDVLSGFQRPDSGQVRLHGKDITQVAPHLRARLGVVRTFQSVESFDPLTVEENLVVAGETRRWWRPLIDLVAPGRDRLPQVAEVLEAVGLEGVRDSYPDELSYGQQKLLGLARAMVRQPSIILLDEPAAGLDTSETRTISDRLRRVNAGGTAMLLVDHDVDLVMGLCHTVYVLDFGRLIAVGPPDTVRRNEAVAKAYLGELATPSGGSP